MIIAIDPGKSGGIAYMMKDNAIEAISMPQTDGEIKELFSNFKLVGGNNVTVVMEKVGGYIGRPQPGSAMFNFGNGFGFLRACAMCNDLRLELVTPQRWQSALSLGTRGSLSPSEWKRKLKSEAQRLYPRLKITNNVADALLILEYARRKV